MFGWLKDWKEKRQQAHLEQEATEAAQKIFAEGDSSEMDDSRFGLTTNAKPRLANQDGALIRTVGDMLYGKLDSSKKVKSAKVVVTYEDDTDTVLFESKGRVQPVLDKCEGADRITFYPPLTVEAPSKA